MPPTEHPHHESEDARDREATPPAEKTLRPDEITALFDRGRQVDAESADLAARRTALASMSAEDAAEDQAREAADARSGWIVDTATKQLGMIRQLLEEKTTRSADTTRRTLRVADGMLDRLLTDALTRAGTLDLYRELSEATRRFEAQANSLERRGRIN